MTKQRHYPYPTLKASDAKLAADTRKIINASLRLLREPVPDTFLGRETLKPLRKEEKEAKGVT